MDAKGTYYYNPYFIQKGNYFIVCIVFNFFFL